MSDEENTRFILVVLVSTFSFLVLFIGIIVVIIRYHKKMIQNQQILQAAKEEFQKKLLQSSIQSQERERERIARDLHDELGASLSAIKLSLGLKKMQRELHSNGIEQVIEMLDNSIQNVKRISRDLLPVSLKKFGLSAAIKNICSESGNENINVQFEESGTPNRFESSNELSVFRIAQELLSNAIQHSKCSVILVSLGWKPDGCSIIVEDNGVGMSEEDSQNSVGLGMDNIHSRAQTIGASISFDKPQYGRGTKVIMSMKLQPL